MYLKRIGLIIAIAMLQSCNTVMDDYLLGKDNTPQPKKLQPIESKLKVSQNWSAPLGLSHKNNEYLKLKPVVRGEIIYSADASGLVQAVSKNGGKLQWSTQLKDGIVSGPAVAEGFVALATSNSTLVLLNQANGKQLWQNKISGEVLSAPVISHQKVIVKTLDGKVLAFDAVNAKPLWHAEHGASGLVLKASSSPIVVDDLVLVGFPDGKLDAYSIQTGQLLWQRSVVYATGSSDVERLIDIDSDPLVKDRVAYLASYQGYIAALSLTDGQFLWKRAGSVYKNMVLRGDNLYYTDSKDVVWSLNRQNGNVNWKQTALKARGLTEPALAGNHLLVGDKAGYLHVLEVGTGELLARSQLSAAVTRPMSVSGKHVYVLTDNGRLNQLSLG